MIIAQISDTHLSVDEPDSPQRKTDFEAVIADINTLDSAPDVIVHTGDIVQNGRLDEYAEAVAILNRANAPVYVMAGNKDDRVNLRKAFSGEAYLSVGTDFISYSVDDFPVRLVMLDTVNPGSKKGEFCTGRLEEFERLVTQDKSKPVAIFAHHPPFEIFVGPEKIHYDDVKSMEDLATAIGGVSQAVALFCGHVHRPAFGDVANVPAAVAPAVATGLRFGDYPPRVAKLPIYFVHRYDPHFGFSTETRIAGG